MCDHELVNDDKAFTELSGGAPYLLGYYPRDCVLVFPHRLFGPAMFTCVLRADITDLINGRIRVDELAKAFHGRHLESVVLMVVGGESGADDDRPPHEDKVADLDEKLLAAGIVVRFSFWVPKIGEGKRWVRYCEHFPQRGVQKDPRVCQLAASAVATGRVIYESVEEFTAMLNPDDKATRHHRQLLSTIGQADEVNGNLYSSTVLARMLREVDQAVCSAGEGNFPLHDRELVPLACALNDPLIWQSSMRYAFTQHRPAAVELWRHLTRVLPGEHRVNASMQLAMASAVCGNTELAKLALRVAAEASFDRATESEWLKDRLRHGLLAWSEIVSLNSIAAAATWEIAMIVAPRID